MLLWIFVVCSEWASLFCISFGIILIFYMFIYFVGRGFVSCLGLFLSIFRFFFLNLFFFFFSVGCFRHSLSISILFSLLLFPCIFSLLLSVLPIWCPFSLFSLFSSFCPSLCLSWSVLLFPLPLPLLPLQYLLLSFFFIYVCQSALLSLLLSLCFFLACLFFFSVFLSYLFFFIHLAAIFRQQQLYHFFPNFLNAVQKGGVHGSSCTLRNECCACSSGHANLLFSKLNLGLFN